MFDLNTLLIAAHVTLGVFAVGAGALALAARKGAATHVSVGRLFALSMGAASLLGAVAGLVQFETLLITFHAGILGTTLVVSGVLAAQMGRRATKRLVVFIAIVNILNAAGLFTLGLYASTQLDTRLFGFPAADYLFLFGMAAIACLGDAGLILCKTLSQRHRVAQHLVRMCTGFFIAAGSAFTGPGASAFPDRVQASGVLSLPELIILITMLVWLFKTLRPRQSAIEIAH